MIEGLEKSKNEKSMKQDLIPQSTYEGNPTPNQAIDEDEIDLVEVLKTIWKDRKLILKAIGVSVFLGLVIALTSPKEYEASAKLIPESTDGSMNLGGLGGLASLAGINVGSAKPGGSAIPPELYPEVVKSVEYYEVLLKKEFFFENKNQSFTILSYFKEEAPKSLFSHVLSSPSKLISLLKSKEGDAVESARFRGIIRLSKAEEDVIKNINDRVSVNVDEKSGIISVAVKMPDAVAAAEVADFTLDYLQNYITEYKISKQQQTVDFISVQYQDQKIKFEEAQEKLALFNDRNRKRGNEYCENRTAKTTKSIYLCF